MVNRPAWASPVAPQITPARPMMSPITLDRRSSFTLPVSWLPICGTWWATASMTLCRNEASTEAARPSTVTRTSSRGNSAMKLE